MRRFGGPVLVLVLAGLVTGCGAGTRETVRGGVPNRFACPRQVLFRASEFAFVGEVLRAAQRVLARQTIDSQGQIYRLTPKWAPIEFVARVSAVESRQDVGYNRLVPGSLAIERAAARQCGPRKANASWAIHYGMPASTIANTGVYTFIVKTRRGWRFWGQWCGAGQTSAWRRENCVF